MKILIKYRGRRFISMAWGICALLAVSLAQRPAHAGNNYWSATYDGAGITMFANGETYDWAALCPGIEFGGNDFECNASEGSGYIPFGFSYGYITPTIHWGNSPVPKQVCVALYPYSAAHARPGFHVDVSDGFNDPVSADSADFPQYFHVWSSGTHRILIQTNGRHDITLSSVQLSASYTNDHPSQWGGNSFALGVTASDSGMPGWLQAGVVSSSEIHLKFSGTINYTSDSIDLYRSESGKPYQKIASGITPSSNGPTEYVDSGLKGNTYYSYYLVHIFPDGTEGSSSLTNSFTTAHGVKITVADLPDGFVGDAYSQQIASTGGDANNSWTIQGNLPPGLTLSGNGTTATIAGTPTDDPTTPGTYPFQVTVDDGTNGTDTASFSLKVDDKLRITTTSLPDGVVGQPYAQDIEASGGDGKFGWVVKNGYAPDGAQFEGDLRLEISGTPTAAGLATFDAIVMDESGHQFTKAFTVNVQSGVPLQITTVSLPTALVGQPYDATMHVAGGNDPYNWSIIDGSLPDGLALLPSGVITGTATWLDYVSAVVPQFTVQITDKYNQTATQVLTIQMDIIDSDDQPDAPMVWPWQFANDMAFDDSATIPSVIKKSKMWDAQNKAAHYRSHTVPYGQWVLAHTVVEKEIAIKILTNISDGHLSGFKPELGVGGCSWLTVVGSGTPRVGKPKKFPVTFHCQIYVPNNAEYFDQARLEPLYYDELDNMATQARIRQEIIDSFTLENRQVFFNGQFTKAAQRAYDNALAAVAQKNMWTRVGQMISQTAKVGYVRLVNSHFSMKNGQYLNGDFVVVANADHINIPGSTVRLVTDEMLRKGYLAEADSALVKSTVALAATMNWKPVVQVLKVTGSRALIVVGVAADVASVYRAHWSWRLAVVKASGWALFSAGCIAGGFASSELEFLPGPGTIGNVVIAGGTGLVFSYYGSRTLAHFLQVDPDQ